MPSRFDTYRYRLVSNVRCIDTLFTPQRNAVKGHRTACGVLPSVNTVFLACRIYPKTASVGGSIPLVSSLRCGHTSGIVSKDIKILCSPHRHKLDGVAWRNEQTLIGEIRRLRRSSILQTTLPRIALCVVRIHTATFPTQRESQVPAGGIPEKLYL